MKKRTPSLLEEITHLAPKKDKNAIFESRGTTLLAVLIAIFIEMIDANFDSLKQSKILNKRIC